MKVDRLTAGLIIFNGIILGILLLASGYSVPFLILIVGAYFLVMVVLGPLVVAFGRRGKHES